MWDPPADVRENIERYLREVVRVLVPGGTFLYITYRQPRRCSPAHNFLLLTFFEP